MREIIFRGKRQDTEKWVEGYYMCLNADDLHFIVDKHGEYHKIDPNTVCQYIGLLDKDGKKIFENDIVKYSYTQTSHKVAFENRFGKAYFGIVMNGINEVWGFCHLVPADKMLVIGNIFDSPELIEELKNVSKRNI